MIDVKMLAVRVLPENRQGDSAGSFGQHQRWLQALEAAARKADSPALAPKAGGRVTNGRALGDSVEQSAPAIPRRSPGLDWRVGPTQKAASQIAAAHRFVAVPSLAATPTTPVEPLGPLAAGVPAASVEPLDAGAGEGLDEKVTAKVSRAVQWVFGEEVQPRAVTAFVGADGRVRVWIRDARMAAEDLQSTAEALDRTLSGEGLNLGELHVNGRLAWVSGR